MLKSITWYDYLIFWIILLGLYYLILLALYGKTILQKFVKSTNAYPYKTGYKESSADVSLAKETLIEGYELSGFGFQQEEGLVPNPITGHINKDGDAHSQLFHTLVDQVESFFEEIANSTPKQEIIKSLKHMLQPYALLKGTSLQEGINSLITDTCESNCSIHLTEDEVSELWQ